MSLITKEVEVNLHNTNINYYEKLGYAIPRYNYEGRSRVKRGTSIWVKVSDLPENSKILVDAECDCCSETLKMPYQNYNKINHNGKTYCRKCYGKVLLSGSNNPNWKENKTDEEREYGRIIPGYKLFIQRVLTRDNYTCKCCGNATSGNLEVHHLDGYDWCIEKRTDDTNGITLCKSCHYNFHLEYGFGNNTKKQFEKWFGKTIENLENYNGEIYSYRKIYCFEEDKIYDSCFDFAEQKNCSADAPYKCCIHRSHSSLGLHVIFLDEYECMTKEGKIEYLKNNKAKHRKNNNYYRQKIICLNNNWLFQSISDAMKWCNYKSTGGFYSYFNGTQKTVGKHPETKEKLEWMYYEDYIKEFDESDLISYQVA